MSVLTFNKLHNNNNNRELIERFWKFKAVYKLKKNIQSANTHNYTNQWYTSVTSQKFHVFIVFLVCADNCSPLAKFRVCR